MLDRQLSRARAVRGRGHIHAALERAERGWLVGKLARQGSGVCREVGPAVRDGKELI